MIIGVGTDIVEIKRVERVCSGKRFPGRIFHVNEKELVAGHPSKAAGNFAVKEAVVKALSSILEKNISYSNIEILKKENGAPYVNLIGCSENIEISISLSHDREKAIAFAAAEKKLKI